jgi:O-acetylserine/cysteine efflux transporter
VPFVGSAASSVVFGETFGPLRLAGMVTVVGGIAVMLLSKRPKNSEYPKASENPASGNPASEKQVLPKIA